MAEEIEEKTMKELVKHIEQAQGHIGSFLKKVNKFYLDKHFERIRKERIGDTRYEELLDEFIRAEREKIRAGSGDDFFYEKQIVDYVNKQRGFWIDFIKFIKKRVAEE